jgi:hypothetical protein
MNAPVIQAKTAADLASADKPPTEYPFHPLANIFPLLEEKKFEGFKKDIKENRQREPIAL